jgi:lipopolysaccharide/colanic/teichoic acid biosynthesis glycosyltransferase
MEGAAAVAVECPAGAGMQIHSSPPRTVPDAPILERSLELVAFPFADLALGRDILVDVRPRERYELVSRAVNVLISLTALLVLSPILLLIALAVKLTSHGPVLYTQIRVGIDRRRDRSATDDRRVFDLGGTPFTMYKFRTMHVNAESDGKAVWAVKQDPRVTLVGRLLRRTRLDELPQLYNVLRGDMNIVGPRPERPALFADLSAGIPHYRLRQRVRPGITGWAQINQPYDACVDDVRRKVQYDLEYLRRQSLLEDLRIMTMTVPVMLFGQKGW